MFLSDLEVQSSVTLDFVSNGVLSVNGSGVVGISGSLAGSSYTPSMTNQSGISSITIGHAYYQQSVDTVTMGLSFIVTNSGINPSFDCSLPVARTGNFSDANQFIAVPVTYNNALTAVTSSPIIQSNTGAQTFHLAFPSLALGTWNVRMTAVYNINS